MTIINKSENKMTVSFTGQEIIELEASLHGLLSGQLVPVSSTVSVEVSDDGITWTALTITNDTTLTLGALRRYLRATGGIHSFARL